MKINSGWMLIIVTIILAGAAGLTAWGSQATTVSEHERRITTVEQDLGSMKGDLRAVRQILEDRYKPSR